MKVKAIQDGYYNHQRQKLGAEFVLKDEKDFSSKWMVKAKKKAKRSYQEPGEAVGEVEPEASGVSNQEVI